MRKISFVIAAAALILTASVGGWVASTTAHDRALHVENFRGGTPVSGGILPPANWFGSGTPSPIRMIVETTPSASAYQEDIPK
jgi:hypothetical protein